MKKWQGLMLIEHTKMIGEWQKEAEIVKRPELEEWELYLIQEEIDIAFRSKCQTHFKMCAEGKIIERQGTIEEIDLHSRMIKLQDPFGIIQIDVPDIVAVNRLN